MFRFNCNVPMFICRVIWREIGRVIWLGICLGLFFSPLIAAAYEMENYHGLQVPHDVCLRLDEATYNCDLKKNATGKLEGVQECSLKSHKEVVYRGDYRAGLLDGKLKCWIDKQPTYEAQFQKGQLQGREFTDWNEDLGRWLRSRTFDAGLQEGYDVSYSTLMSFPDGKRKTTLGGPLVTPYKKGEKNGYVLVFENGKVVNASECRINGKSAADPKQCDKISMGPYDEKVHAFFGGEKAAKTKSCEGPQTRWLSNEQYLEKYNAKDCEADGLSTLFARDGKTKVVETHFKAGKREGEQKVFFPEGEVAKSITYKDDHPTRIHEFFQNGQTKLDVAVTYPDKKTIRYDFKVYWDNGKLGQTGQSLGDALADEYHSIPYVSDSYAHDKGIGCHKLYDHDGKETASDCFNDNGVRDGAGYHITETERIEEQYRLGKLVSRKILDLDGHLKKSIEYYPDGSVKSQKP